MSPETVGAGWLLVGAAFAVVGIGIIAWVRWSRDDKPVAAPCEHCGPLAMLVSEGEAEIHRAVRDEETLRVAGLVSVAPVIPLQRDGRDS